MPAYLIAYETPNKISIGYLHNILTLGLPQPVNYLFLACIMAYFLLMVIKVNPWIGIMGALAYAYSTFDPIIITVGHDTQMICIAYAPAVIGSLLLLFQKRYIIGTVLMSFFTSMILFQNHIQVTYYTMLMAFAIGVAFMIDAIRNKEIAHAVKAGALAAISGLIAIGVCAINLFPQNEFAKETMRGGRSELTDTTSVTNKSKGGLDKDYAFQFGSYGISETFTFFVPDIYGGGKYNTEMKPGKSGFVDKLIELGEPEESAKQYGNQMAYWGKQPGHAGPVYLGAIICFLFITSFFFVKGWLKWALVTVSAFAIILAWGKNSEGLNYFLFDHLPYLNKFRAASMALVIPQLCFVVLAAMSLNEILFGNINKEEAWKKFRFSIYTTAGVFILLMAMYFSFDYTGMNDAGLKENFTGGMIQQLAKGQQPTPQIQQQADEFGRSVIKMLKADRQSLFGGDLLRSLLFVLLAAASVGLYLKNKIKAMIALAVIIVLSSLDLLLVGKRYLDNDKFVDATDVEGYFTPTAATKKIQADPDKNFRVLDESSGNPFHDSKASYYHNSVGGYTPVGLGLYQDLVNHQLEKGNISVLNMLNTKYFIVQNPANGQPAAQLNPGALGNCWFVKGFSLAKNADDEMKQLNTLNTKDSAVIDTRYEKIAGREPVFDSAASIKMLENLNDKITYKSSASKPQFAVFSEVYYPHGWDAYIDGKKAEYCRVNYVLRGMPVPAGDHAIEFRFEPNTVIVSDMVSKWSSVLLYLMLVAGLVFEYRKKKTV
jgi:hypothetical protein